MNTLWLSNLEILMEERRADFRREMEQLRLEREAQTTKPRNLNWLVPAVGAGIALTAFTPFLSAGG